MNDLEGVLDDPHGQEFLAIVTSVHHERRRKSLHNGTSGFAETLGLVTARWVRQVLGMLLLDRDVILVIEIEYKYSDYAEGEQDIYTRLG